MKYLGILLLILFGSAAIGEVVVPVRTIRANAIISVDDLALKQAKIPGTFSDPRNVIGQEARVALYAGRPIRLDDIGPPAIVERNQIVALYFSRNGLNISTEGRALARGGIGDRILVMNLTSRATLFGLVRSDGSIQVVKR